MQQVLPEPREDLYLEILLNRIRVCRAYKPKFGQGGDGFSLAEFRDLYGSDPFYSWLGLNNPLVYAAHRAAGGITSVYRQIGMGCEELVRQVLMDSFDLNNDQVNWSYAITQSGRTRRLSLDARVELLHVSSEAKRQRVFQWIGRATAYLQVDQGVSRAIRGTVFEVRQGYKSKDSKRQNADIANAARAYSQGYLPVVLVLSTQIDSDISDRYQNANCLVLKGYLDSSDIRSTYAFFREVVGYDLADFFERNSGTLRAEIEDVLETLLQPHD